MTRKTTFMQLALATAALVVAAPVLATCGGTAPVISGASGQYRTVATMPGTVGTNIINHMWVQGNGAAENAEGCAGMTTGFGTVNGHYRWNSAGSFNWQTCGTGCNLSKKTTALTSGMDNNGTPRAYFFVASVLAIGTRTQMYDISNGQATTDGTTACTGGASCVMDKILTPIPAVRTRACTLGTCTYSKATGTGSIEVSITLPFGAADARNFRGYFSAGGAPAADFIVYELYQVNGSAAPAAGAANWPGAAVASFTAADCTGAVCTKMVNVTVPTGNGLGAFYAIRPFVDGFARADFLAVQSARLSSDPLAVEGLPTSVEIYPTKVNNAPGFQARWTSTNENEVASYKLMASRDGSNWVVVADNIATKGAGTYTQNITRRSVLSKAGPATSYQIKVVVVKRDGTTQDAGPSTYTWTPARAN